MNIDSERASSCQTGYSQAEMKWITIPGIGEYQWTYLITVGGQAHLSRLALPAGDSSLEVEMHWDASNPRRNLVLKSYAP